MNIEDRLSLGLGPLLPMQKYRFNGQLRGTIAGKDHRGIATIPAGSVVELVGHVENGADQVEVLWEGRPFWLFAVDFRAQATGVGHEVSTPVLIPPVTPTPSVKQTDEPQPPTSAVRVRRFNAAGRELF